MRTAAAVPPAGGSRICRRSGDQSSPVDVSTHHLHHFCVQAGADVVFIDALESAAEMEALCKVQGAYKVR